MSERREFRAKSRSRETEPERFDRLMSASRSDLAKTAKYYEKLVKAVKAGKKK